MRFNPKINHSSLVLTALALVVYFSIFFSINTKVCSEIMFSTPDARSYKDVADWILFHTESESVSIRPILYPLLILTSNSLGGIYGIWFLQFTFWLLSIHFTFLAVKHITKSNAYAFAGSIFLISNLSLIALTLHGLTEITTVFLLSILILYIARKKDEYLSPKFFNICTLLLVILTLVKPTFYLPLLALLFIAFPFIYLRKFIKKPSHFLKLALILLPLIVQLSIIKTKYGELKVSLIGSITLREYILPQGIEKIEGISFDEARIKSREFSQKEQLAYMANHFPTYLNLFFTNIKDNLKGSPTFLLYPEGYENQGLAKYESKYNKAYFILAIILTALTIPILIILYKHRSFPPLVFLLIAFALWLYYILVTGISFWQGDRLTLPSLVILASVFPVVIFHYFEILIKRKKQSTNVN
jgi:hypothetical protein